MPVITRKKLPNYAITDETVEQWMRDELEGSPVEPDKELARECALAILNQQREENDQEPLQRCPSEAAETVLSYMQAIVAEGILGSDDGTTEADEGANDEGESSEGRSIIKRKYKTRYRPFKMTCGDELAGLVSDHVKFKDEDGKMRVDPDKLRDFAIANGCWDERYEHLNVGMRRMNAVNRLRARVKHGHDIIWN